MNELSNLKPPAGAVKRRKRVGRGTSSGKGKTSGRGHKGQNSRSGGGVRPGFEGGQMPLQRRLPKRGFSNYPHKLGFEAVNVGTLNSFEDGATIDLDAIKRAGLAKGHDVRVKITGNGELTTSLVVKASRIAKKGVRPERTRVERQQEYLVVSNTAAEKIKAAGGQVEVL
jgi:large subunit ribosomal protein L15